MSYYLQKIRGHKKVLSLLYCLVYIVQKWSDTVQSTDWKLEIKQVKTGMRGPLQSFIAYPFNVFFSLKKVVTKTKQNKENTSSSFWINQGKEE